jgi:serine/threonine protein kinase
MGLPSSPGHGSKLLILNRYAIIADGILGEGTWSISHRGIDKVTGEEVAITIYKKDPKELSRQAFEATTLAELRRQVAVLQELHKPLVPPADPRLWSEELAQADPGDLFVRLLAYSKRLDGKPGPDRDGDLYVVTELAQYDLKQYLRERKGKKQPLSGGEVKSIAKSIIISVAGLHAKGFTHLDLKPANVVMIGGRWKIAVDSCFMVGAVVEAGRLRLRWLRQGWKLIGEGGAFSFSPCYCAPEWARLVVRDTEEPMLISPSLDTWSIGMTLCELITLHPAMTANYQEMSESRAVCWEFLSRLGKVSKFQLPGAIGRFDTDFHDLLSKWLLVSDGSERKSLAECLACPFLATTPTAAFCRAPSSPALKNAVKRTRSALPVPAGQRTTSVLLAGLFWQESAHARPCQC